MFSSQLINRTTVLRTSAASCISLTSIQKSQRFSTNCAPAQKLRTVLEEYRLQNYSYETPNRFRKEMIKFVSSDDGTVSADRLNQVLINIGRPDQILSDEEFDILVQEADAKGGEGTTTTISSSSTNKTRSIPSSSIIQLM